MICLEDELENETRPQSFEFSIATKNLNGGYKDKLDDIIYTMKQRNLDCLCLQEIKLHSNDYFVKQNNIENY
jgi:exonuclease III